MSSRAPWIPSSVAAKYLLNRGLANRILILDLDVHQGNGNSEIFKGPIFHSTQLILFWHSRIQFQYIF